MKFFGTNSAAGPSFQEDVIVTSHTSATSGNHTINANTKMITIIGISGGCGGGSGRKGLTTAAGGGAGGRGGGGIYFSGPATLFSSPVPYQVGAGGPGGASQTTDGQNGNPGTAGTLTFFGSIEASTAPVAAPG